MSKPLRFAILVYILLMLANIPQLAFRDTGYNTAIHLADAFIHGRLDVVPPENPVDLIEHQGRYYVPFPPAPALLLTPMVAIFGLDLNPLWLTPLLGALTALVFFSLYRRITHDDRLSYLLSAAMIFGTAYWLCVRYAFDAYLAHLVAVLALGIALRESVGRRRGWMAGLCLGIACTSRQLTVFTIPFVFAVLAFAPDRTETPARRWRACAETAIVLGLILAALMGYNHARFGSPLDSGYARVIEQDWYAYRLARWGNFNWRYVPSNLLRLFVTGFSITFDPPAYMIPRMSHWGTSLTFASPFVFFGLIGRWPGRRILDMAGWGCVAATLAGVLLHKSAGGGWQINGMRYALDFLPLWSIFVAYGMKRAGGGAGGWTWIRAAIAYAIGLNVLAIALTHARVFFPG